MYPYIGALDLKWSHETKLWVYMIKSVMGRQPKPWIMVEIFS
jgi:hypothetical protein